MGTENIELLDTFFESAYCGDHPLPLFAAPEDYRMAVDSIVRNGEPGGALFFVEADSAAERALRADFKICGLGTVSTAGKVTVS